MTDEKLIDRLKGTDTHDVPEAVNATPDKSRTYIPVSQQFAGAEYHGTRKTDMSGSYLLKQAKRRSTK